MKLKRILAAVLTLSTAVLAFTGCGSAKTESSAEATTVKIGVVGSIYEDLWKPAQEALKDEGINLEIVQFSDYSSITFTSIQSWSSMDMLLNRSDTPSLFR